MPGPVVTSVVISIVSHGHGALALRLLGQLAALPAGRVAGVVLTLNAPHLDEAFEMSTVPAALATSLNLQVLRNTKPLGFGANHNRAFKAASQHFGAGGAGNAGIFCVLNPDIELQNGSSSKLDKDDVLTALSNALAQPGVGLAYPVQLNAAGHLLDHERALPTPRAILFRQFSRIFGTLPAPKHGSEVGQPDWVSGAVLAFKADAFAALGGFDERFFMYCEDVDICLRLKLAGYGLAKSNVAVVHHTQRRTLTNLQHFTWHVSSLLRLWRSSAYHAYVDLLAARTVKDD